jgi:hypothetical protein
LVSRNVTRSQATVPSQSPPTAGGTGKPSSPVLRKCAGAASRPAQLQRDPVSRPPRPVQAPHIAERKKPRHGEARPRSRIEEWHAIRRELYQAGCVSSLNFSELNGFRVTSAMCPRQPRKLSPSDNISVRGATSSDDGDDTYSHSHSHSSLCWAPGRVCRLHLAMSFPDHTDTLRAQAVCRL